MSAVFSSPILEPAPRALASTDADLYSQENVGLCADYGEVIWDGRYHVPHDVAGDVCDYPLARNLVLLDFAVASEVVVRFALAAVRHDFSVTLRDFAISAVES